MDTFQDRIIEYQGTEISELKQRIEELEAQLAAAEREAWNAAIEAAAKSCEGEEYKHYGGYFAEEIRGLKK